MSLMNTLDKRIVLLKFFLWERAGLFVERLHQHKRRLRGLNPLLRSAKGENTHKTPVAFRCESNSPLIEKLCVVNFK
jgi:hypothetical protein